MRSLLFLVLAVALAFALSREELAPPPAGPGPAVAAPAAAPAPAAAAAPGTAAVDRAAPPVRAAAVTAPGGGLRVRAVDGAGRPVAGATVWLDITRRTATGEPAESTQNLPVCGADGTTALADAAGQLAAADVVAARLSARILGAAGPPVPLAPRALPAGVVDVEVPAHGRVRVELRWADGQPWGLDVPEDHFQLTPLDAAGRPGRGEFWAAPVRGVADYEFVALGQRFRAGSRREWGPPVEFAGPAVPGATVMVTLTAAPRLRLVTGRILGPDGAPCRLPVQFEAARDGRSSGGQLVLDAEGRFVAAIAGFLGPTPRLWFDAPAPAGRVAALVELGEPLQPGRRDLGDVVLREAPLLVAGQLHWAPGAAAPAGFDGVQLRVDWSADGRDPWQGELLPVAIAADGRFAYRAHPRAAHHRLVVRGRVAPRDPVPFDPGSASLVVPIAPPSRLEVAFVVGPEQVPWQFEIAPLPGTPRLDLPVLGVRSPLDQLGPPGVGRPRREGDRMVVEFANLAAGSYTVTARRGTDRQVVELRVEVPAAGAAGAAPPLEFDLRSR